MIPAELTHPPVLTQIPQFVSPIIAQTTTPETTLYQGWAGRVTIVIPSGGRYIVIGDSLSYGSTISGKNTYDDICNNRWPYVEQLAVETDFSTASLDRGDSMKTPFFSTTSITGKITSYCEPPTGTPKLSTAVAGSNTSEWIDSLLYYPVMTESSEITWQPGRTVPIRG